MQCNKTTAATLGSRDCVFSRRAQIFRARRDLVWAASWTTTIARFLALLCHRFTYKGSSLDYAARKHTHTQKTTSCSRSVMQVLTNKRHQDSPTPTHAHPRPRYVIPWGNIDSLWGANCYCWRGSNMYPHLQPWSFPCSPLLLLSTYIRKRCSLRLHKKQKCRKIDIQNT